MDLYIPENCGNIGNSNTLFSISPVKKARGKGLKQYWSEQTHCMCQGCFFGNDILIAGNFSMRSS